MKGIEPIPGWNRSTTLAKCIPNKWENHIGLRRFTLTVLRYLTAGLYEVITIKFNLYRDHTRTLLDAPKQGVHGSFVCPSTKPCCGLRVVQTPHRHVYTLWSNPLFTGHYPWSLTLMKFNEAELKRLPG